MISSGPTCVTCGGLTSMGVQILASKRTTMRVLVSKEMADDLWYAEGIDIWLTSSGETKEAAQAEFVRAVKRSADLTMQPSMDARTYALRLNSVCITAPFVGSKSLNSLIIVCSLPELSSCCTIGILQKWPSGRWPGLPPGKAARGGRPGALHLVGLGFWPALGCGPRRFGLVHAVGGYLSHMVHARLLASGDLPRARKEFGSVAGLLGDQSFTSRMADRVALDSYAMESEPFSHEHLPFTAVMWLSPV